MRTFKEFVHAKRRSDRFIEWVLQEGIYLNGDVLVEKLQEVIKEGVWTVPNRSDYRDDEAGEAEYMGAMSNASRRRMVGDKYWINDTGRDDYLGGDVNDLGNYGYRPDDDPRWGWNTMGDRRAKADQGFDYKNAQPLQGDLRFTSSGQSQKFYNDAVTALRGLMSRQPRIRGKLEQIVKVLRQTLV